MPVMHQAVKAFLANQRQGNAATKIRKYVDGGNQKPWKQKGTGRARAGLDARAALGGRRHGLRTDPAQLRAVRAAPGARARAQERAQRAGSRERDLRHRPLRLRRAEDVAPRGAGRPARRRREEGADSHRRREAERVPQRPQPADRARDAVQRRLDVPHPLVGRRADRGRRDRADARADGREREAARAKKKPAKPPAKKPAAKKAGEESCREEASREEGAPKKAPPRSRGEEGGAKKPAARSRAKKKGK